MKTAKYQPLAVGGRSAHAVTPIATLTGLAVLAVSLVLGGCATKSGMSGSSGSSGSTGTSGSSGGVYNDSGRNGGTTGTSGKMDRKEKGDRGDRNDRSDGSGSSGSSGAMGGSGMQSMRGVVQSIEPLTRQQAGMNVTGAMGAAAAGGAMPGSGAPGDRVYRVTLRAEDGSSQSIIVEMAPDYGVGDRVVVSNGSVSRQ